MGSWSCILAYRRGAYNPESISAIPKNGPGLDNSLGAWKSESVDVTAESNAVIAISCLLVEVIQKKVHSSKMSSLSACI